jgi:hypothetical protein
MKQELNKYVANLKQSNLDISQKLNNDVTFFYDSERSHYVTKFNIQLQIIKDLEQILNK